MKRRTRAWALLGAASCAWACSDGAGSGDANGGAPTTSAGSSGTAATTAGTASGGTATSAGTGGAATVAGSGGQSTSGAATGGTTSGGSTSGGAATAGGGGQSPGGSAGSGGSGGAANPTLPKRVLLYHFSTLTIASVPAQLTLLKNQLMTWGYEVEDSVKPEDISTANLARFGGVAMINTCFEPFGTGKTGEAQTAALKAFVENDGGGLFGTHCASVTFQSASPPNAYNVLLGGRGGKDNFDGKSACTTTAEAHVTTAMLPATFDFTGNLDNADYVADDTKVLVKCKWSGGAMKDTAVSWYRTPGKGRVFYTNFAKVDADLSDATLGQKHILLGLGWTLGR
ncbi:MAG: ThuA domain-containing protein [Myxococcales bacterium]